MHEILKKFGSKNQLFSFRLDSPELIFNFFCYSNIVVKMYQILIEANRGKKRYGPVYQKKAIFSIEKYPFLVCGMQNFNFLKTFFHSILISYTN
jgi:hypothetical protein